MFYKHHSIIFDLPTKDNKKFYCYLEYDVKWNLRYLRNVLFDSNKLIVDNAIISCIREFFKIFVNMAWIFEGTNPNRLIDECKLKLVNSHINTLFVGEYCPHNFVVKNIKITHLIIKNG